MAVLPLTAVYCQTMRKKGSSLRNHALVACKDPDCPICHPKPKMPAPAAPPPAAPLFQVQLQLLADGRPAAGLTYSCYLSDGTRAAGTTDGQGLSGAIVTRTEASVLRIGVSAPSKSSSAACCSAPEAWWQDERLYVGGDGNALAKTVLSATPPVVPISLPNGKERPLTRGEEAMARTVFGDGIDYSKIKIHHGGWWVFAGNQDPDTAVTPNSKIYMPSAIYRDDYSAEHAADRRLFMHELVHVWQFKWVTT